MSKHQPPGVVKYRALTQSAKSVTGWAIFDTFPSWLVQNGHVKSKSALMALLLCHVLLHRQSWELERWWMLKENVRYSLFTCAQYLFQKPVEDLDFKMMFVVVILFRSCSSTYHCYENFHFSYYGVLSYFKLMQQNVYFWYMFSLCLYMHRLCNILFFSVPQLKQHSIFARKMLNFVKNPLNSFYKRGF